MSVVPPVSPIIPLVISIFFAVIIILVFTFYISVAKNLSFKKRFLRMLLISLGVAVISFFIGFLINDLGFNA
jgi:VIT1/CCC1 family predicted Fe2+/Mn2+ transporter